METKNEILLIDLPCKALQLSQKGFRTTNYSNTAEALAEISRRVKMGLPSAKAYIVNNFRININEFEWFKDVLKSAQHDAPMIIMDHLPSEEKMKSYKASGVHDYLDKNCQLDVLLKQIDRLDIGVDKTKSQAAKPKPQVLKRAFDIVVASVLLLLLSPLFLIVIIAIKLESKGPAFYWQKRVGTGYKIFNFYKFRSMRTDADKLIDSMSGANHYEEQTEVAVPKQTKQEALTILVEDGGFVEEENFIAEQEQSATQSFKKFQNDPRITKVGHFIRKTSIDELPQLINVLIGDMSLVGNRPLPLYEAETLTNDEWSERFMAPAGITGLWQVTERGKSSTSSDSRKKLDIEYARNHNFLMDLKILIKTPLAALQSENV